MLAIALLLPGSAWLGNYHSDQAAGLMIFQLPVSLALLYGSLQKLRGSEIAERVYRAACVSYLLWLCMLLRWLNHAA